MQTFYGCYLLESLSQRNRTYIGFTMDPCRRLRQHNGEIAAGAWKTHKGRPWKMVLCVWGLPNKIAALQFEYAWQHPAVCRHVKGAVSHLGFCNVTARGRQRAVMGTKKNLQVLLEMLQVSPYCRMPLCVHILDSKAYVEVLPHLKAVELLPEHIKITHGSLEDLENICAEEMRAVHQPVSGALCSACAEGFHTGDRVVSCPHCRHSLHVTCAARAFTSHTGRLMPVEPAACPRCQQSVAWPVLVKSNRRLSRTPSGSDNEQSDAELENNHSSLAQMQQPVTTSAPLSDAADAPLLISDSDDGGSPVQGINGDAQLQDQMVCRGGEDTNPAAVSTKACTGMRSTTSKPGKAPRKRQLPTSTIDNTDAEAGARHESLRERLLRKRGLDASALVF